MNTTWHGPADWTWNADETHRIQEILEQEKLRPLDLLARERLRRSIHQNFLLAPELFPILQTQLAKRHKAWGDVEKLSNKLLEVIKSAEKSVFAHEIPSFMAEAKSRILEVECFAIGIVEDDPISKNGKLTFLAPYKDLKSPEQAFYRDIMLVWTELGGYLGASTDKDNKVSGPFVRFFQAVAEPIMGDSCPAPATIKKLVISEKKRRNGEADQRKNAKQINKGRGIAR